MDIPGWTDGSDDDQVAEVMAAERETLSPDCRADPARLDAFLADDFHEFGSSGREYAKTGTAGMVAGAVGDPIAIDRLRGLRITDGVVMLKYDTRAGTRTSHRTSVWRRTEAGGWQMFHHQGTPFSAG